MRLKLEIFPAAAAGSLTAIMSSSQRVAISSDSADERWFQRCSPAPVRWLYRERKCADTLGTVPVPRMRWPFPMLKYKYIFSAKIHGSNFIKQHSETVMV